MLTLTSTTCWGNGFYIGVGAGPEYADFSQIANIRPGNVDNVNDTDHKSGQGAFGSLFVGIDRDLNGCNLCDLRFYLAGEANFNISSLEFHSTNNEFAHHHFVTTKYKLPYNFGLSVLPGFWYMDNTLFYARLGYVLSNFKVETGDTSLQNVNRTINGFRLGAGLRRKIGTQLSVRFEYSYADYENTNLFTLDRGSHTPKKTAISPTTGEVMFGIVYDFC